MVDVFSMLVSIGMLGIVVFFAMRFDKTQEWFQRPRNPNPAPKVGAGTRVLAGRGTMPETGAGATGAGTTGAGRRPPTRFQGGGR